MSENTQILIAGIGNIFHGDDGFGVEVVRRLSHSATPPYLSIQEFGIRGFDLAMAICNAKSAIVMVDAAIHGDAPGTLRVLEPSANTTGATEMHRLEPSAAISLARRMGANLPTIRLVSCEPQTFDGFDLSRPVRDAVDAAVTLVLDIAERLKSTEVRFCTNSV